MRLVPLVLLACLPLNAPWAQGVDLSGSWTFDGPKSMRVPERLVIRSTSQSLEQGVEVTVETERVIWLDEAGDLVVERTGTPASAVTPSRSVCTKTR